MSERSRSISPSSSIRSRSGDNSDSDESEDFTRYEGLTEDELNAIWERRNLAYFDRRQRKLAEERERQQQQQGDDSVAHDSGSSISSASVQEQLGGAAAAQSGQQQQQQLLAPPAGYLCAADSPQWREMTSHNIMGDYDAERASRDPAYLYAWTSCQRLVDMHRSGATAGNFIPTNPRLAALLELRRRDVARERHEEETARRQQQQSQGGAAQQQHNMMMVDDNSAVQEIPSFAASAAVPTAAPAAVAAQQAAAYERLHQARMLEQQRGGSVAYAQGNSIPKSSSSGSSGSDKSVQTTPSYYMALPYPTQQLTKPVSCGHCSLALYTTIPACRFFCQTCGCISSVPLQDADACFEEKMQDAEDLDVKMSSY